MLSFLTIKKIEPYDDSHLQPHVGQRDFCSVMLYFTRQSTLFSVTRCNFYESTLFYPKSLKLLILKKTLFLFKVS